MRFVLTFCPSASPTYVPLGITSLFSYIRNNVPDCSINAVDLNIAVWNWIIDQNEELHTFRNFMWYRQNGFFDETLYKLHLPFLKQIAGTINGYIDMSRLYLEKGTLTPELHLLLNFQSGLVMASDPEVIGFSIMYPNQVLMSLALAKFVSSLIAPSGSKGPMILLGGAMISALRPEEILTACPYVDAVYEGEGETGLGMLCAGKGQEQIPGLVYRTEFGIHRNKKTETISLSKLPLPDFSEMNLSLYLNPEPVVPMVFSRGCKWRKCRFCTHNFSYSGYRSRNIIRFVDYLSHLSCERGVRHFYFADQYVDAPDMKMLADEILNRGLKLYFHLMGRPTSDYTPEVLQTLYKSGCRWISWGIESGSQRLLEICQKGTTVDTIRSLTRNSHQAGISNLYMMIFGLPTGRDADFKATLDLLDDMDEFVDDVKCSSFQLFDKTSFASGAKNYGLNITGREILLTTEHGSVGSNRLFYEVRAEDGTWCDPRGSMEIAQLQRRKLWAGEPSIYKHLSCEHYLLYASHRSVSFNDQSVGDIST